MFGQRCRRLLLEVFHSNRVYAADRCLSVGRAWIASQHLKTALTMCRNGSPNDEEWAKMIREFE
jgi:hypothetical protein